MLKHSNWTSIYFRQNGTHFQQIDSDLTVPLDCAVQTPANNKKCQPFFVFDPRSYILQCRGNTIVATGNISFFNPKLEVKQLNFVPSIIANSDFPVKISNQEIFADTICNNQQQFYNLPRQKFVNFYKNNKISC